MLNEDLAIGFGMRRWTDELGVHRTRDPWWSVRLWSSSRKSAICDHGVKLGPLEVTVYRYSGRWDWSCRLVGTQRTAMIID